MLVPLQTKMSNPPLRARPLSSAAKAPADTFVPGEKETPEERFQRLSEGRLPPPAPEVRGFVSDLLEAKFRPALAERLGTKLLEPVGETSVPQRTQAFRRMGLIGGEGHLSREAGVDALYDAWARDVQAGGDPEASAARLADLAGQLQPAPEEKPGEFGEALEFVQKSPELEPFFLKLVDAKFHLGRAVHFANLLAEPLREKDLDQRSSAFQSLVLDSSHKFLNQYDAMQTVYEHYRQRGGDEASVARDLGVAGPVLEGCSGPVAPALDAYLEATHSDQKARADLLLELLATYHVPQAVEFSGRVGRAIGQAGPEENVTFWRELPGEGLMRSYALKGAALEAYESMCQRQTPTEAARRVTAFAEMLAEGENLLEEDPGWCQDFLYGAATVVDNPELTQFFRSLIPSFHFHYALDYTRRLAEPLPGTRLKDRIEMTRQFGWVGGEDNCRRYDVKGTLYDLYCQSLDGPAVLDFMQAIRKAQLPKEGTGEALRAAFGVAQEGPQEKSALKELLADQYHLDKAVEFLRMWQTGDGLEQNRALFKEALGECRQYAVLSAGFRTLTSLVEAGTPRRQAVALIQEFGPAVESAQVEKDTDHDQAVASLFSHMEVQPPAGRAFLREMLEAKFHLGRAQGFSERIAEPLPGTNLEERLQAFRDLGFLAAEGLASRYDVMGAAWTSWQKRVDEGQEAPAATASLRDFLKAIAPAQLTHPERLDATFRTYRGTLEGQPALLDFLRRLLTEKVELSQAVDLSRRVERAAGESTLEQRLTAFEQLGLAARPEEIQIAALEAYRRLVTRGNPSEASASALASYLEQLDQRGLKAEALARELNETVSMVIGSEGRLEVEQSEDRVVVGGIVLPRRRA